MDPIFVDEEAQLRARDQAARQAVFFLFVRMAAGITGAFGLVTLTLGLSYGDSRRLAMSAVLFTYAGAIGLLRLLAQRGSLDHAAFLTAVLTLASAVALAVLHPGIHSALVLAALFPAAVALQFGRGRAQRALMVLSWVASVCVGLAAEYVAPSGLVPDSVQRPFRLLSIAAASGVFVMLLWRYANRLFDRVDEARAGQAAAAAATAALAAEHERLAVTLASIGEAVIVTDASGRVTMMNTLARRVAGADAHGRRVADVCRFEDARGRALDPVAEAAGSGRLVKSDEPMTLVRTDGQRFRVDGSAAPMRTESGAVVGAVIVLRDVSERVRFEEELREAQKLDAIGRLAGGVAHDFNNQLTSILGYTELLVWSFDEGDPRRQDMEEIRKAADRAALVTQQLLAFSRRQILQPRLVHVPDVVTRSVRLLHRILPSHIVIDTAMSDAIEPVLIDPHQLGHVLLNLAVSARDTMPEGGGITVRAATLVVGAHEASSAPAGLPPGTWVRLVVEDTGSGIPAERLPRLFEPFANQTAQSPGSLELAVVHGIVTQSGGRIQVESEPGRGTRFSLYFPAAIEAADAAADAVAAPAGGHESVLLVEDDAAVRALLVSTLARQGYSVTAAAGAVQALAGLGPPLHALVVDLALPDAAGEQLAAAVVKQFPGLPVIYISGPQESASSDTTRPPGHLLRKPFTPRDLLVVLRQTLDQARPAARRSASR
jgi:two-component system cell cycle sensor histidine kinase/response regulator CckA